MSSASAPSKGKANAANSNSSAKAMKKDSGTQTNVITNLIHSLTSSYAYN